MPARFIEDDTVVDLDYPAVAHIIQRSDVTWLSHLAQAACLDDHTVRLRVGGTDLSSLRKAFRVTVGLPYKVSGGLLVPTLWEATGATGLFPTMEADLRVTPWQDGRTRICLQGRYLPPLGHFGERLDDLLLHRVVEAGIAAFLTSLGRTLDARDGRWHAR